MRIGILCENHGLAEWQYRAVRNVAAGNSLYLIECGSPPAPRRRLRHAAYYALNLFTIRNRMTRLRPFPDDAIAIAGRYRLEPEFDGAWAILPDEAIAWIREQRLDAIVKFGLGLLRVPEPGALSVPILSFHHGDPSRYRGRPAGFYELRERAPFVGQVVQILSNRLDSGEVLAFAESRAVAHSYRKTLIGAYRLSPHLLSRALDALQAGKRVEIGHEGRNCRLPGNGEVLRFITERFRALVRRLLYGAFVEKRWSVAWSPVAASGGLGDRIRAVEVGRGDWTVPDRKAEYSFYADPFFLAGSDDILVEAMRSASGKGELLRISKVAQARVEGFAGHVSYPSNLEENGRIYLAPEISDWSAQALFELRGGKAIRADKFDCGGARLLDPTLVKHDGRFYLFGNRVEDGADLLHLWVAESLNGPYRLHPGSPVRVSARGSRMAGDVYRSDDALYRIGQDCRGGYGDGVLIFRIAELSHVAYREEPAGEVAFRSVRGPHTVNLRDSTLLFDWYEEKFSLLAGARRLSNRIYRIISG